MWKQVIWHAHIITHNIGLCDVLLFRRFSLDDEKSNAHIHSIWLLGKRYPNFRLYMEGLGSLFFQKKPCVDDKRAYAQNKEWKVDKMAPPTIEWKLFLLFINSIKYGEWCDWNSDWAELIWKWCGLINAPVQKIMIFVLCLSKNWQGINYNRPLLRRLKSVCSLPYFGWRGEMKNGPPVLHQPMRWNMILMKASDMI